MKLSSLTLAAFCTALMALLAQITIPLPLSPVPFTGQLVGVFLTASLLRPKMGLLALSAYLLLGAAGAPVFSFSSGGLAILSGPSGGYLWGFLPAVLIASGLLARKEDKNLIKSALFLLPALAALYLCGALQLGLLMRYSLKQAVLVGILPFLALDLAKLFVAAVLSRKIKKSLRQNGLAHLLEN